MKNPLRRSGPSPKTHDRVQVRRGYSYDVFRTFRVRGYSYIKGKGKKRRRVRVPGRTVREFVRTVRVRARYAWRLKAGLSEVWGSVREHQGELQERYKFRQADPMYRFQYFTDVVHKKTAFVWDKPLRADAGGGLVFPPEVFGFRGVRLWFVVRYEASERFELWARTIRLRGGVNSWAELLEAKDDLVARFEEESERSQGQMESVALAGWTAYVKISDDEGEVPMQRSTGAGRPGYEVMPTRKAEKRARRTTTRKPTTGKGRKKSVHRRRGRAQGNNLS